MDRIERISGLREPWRNRQIFLALSSEISPADAMVSPAGG